MPLVPKACFRALGDAVVPGGTLVVHGRLDRAPTEMPTNWPLTVHGYANPHVSRNTEGRRRASHYINSGRADGTLRRQHRRQPHPTAHRPRTRRLRRELPRSGALGALAEETGATPVKVEDAARGAEVVVVTAGRHPPPSPSASGRDQAARQPPAAHSRSAALLPKSATFLSRGSSVYWWKRHDALMRGLPAVT